MLKFLRFLGLHLADVDSRVKAVAAVEQDVRAPQQLLARQHIYLHLRLGRRRLKKEWALHKVTGASS